jgi:hypothetical protein
MTQAAAHESGPPSDRALSCAAACVIQRAFGPRVAPLDALVVDGAAAIFVVLAVVVTHGVFRALVPSSRFRVRAERDPAKLPFHRLVMPARRR